LASPFFLFADGNWPKIFEVEILRTSFSDVLRMTVAAYK
jgi:hypothetical protein